MSALRELSNLSNPTGDAKHRQASRLATSSINSNVINISDYRAGGSQRSFRSQSNSLNDVPRPIPPTTNASAAPASPKYTANARHAGKPTYCTELIDDITDMFLERERQAVRRFNEGTAAHQSNAGALYSYYASPHCLQYQPEVNEKMRMILIDWLVDVHLKFKLHHETIFLAVNIIDRYLSCVNTKHNTSTYVPRAQLQLVGVSAVLLAAKYEEIWPPEVKECVHISANTYTREDIIKMERSICTALCFRLTVPTAFPFASRLLTVLEGEDFLGVGADSETRKDLFALLRNTVGFFMEHAMLDYKCLQFTPSQVGNACLYLALTTLRIKYDVPLPTGNGNSTAKPVWSDVLQHYSRAEVRDFRGCAEVILEFVSYVPTTKYQAVRRKYNSSRYGEVAKMIMPNELPQL